MRTVQGITFYSPADFETKSASAQRRIPHTLLTLLLYAGMIGVTWAWASEVESWKHYGEYCAVFAK